MDVITMLILNINSFCRELSPILQLIGQVLTIFKVLLPLVLIVLGIFDIGKAVISSKTDDIKKYMKNFVKRVAVVVLIYFVPTLIMVVFGFVGNFNEITEYSGLDYDVCYDCLFKPNSYNCQDSVSLSN